MHGRVHSIHISLEPPKALAENTKKTCNFPNRTATGLHGHHYNAVRGQVSFAVTSKRPLASMDQNSNGIEFAESRLSLGMKCMYRLVVLRSRCPTNAAIWPQVLPWATRIEMNECLRAWYSTDSRCGRRLREEVLQDPDFPASSGFVAGERDARPVGMQRHLPHLDPQTYLVRFASRSGDAPEFVRLVGDPRSSNDDVTSVGRPRDPDTPEQQLPFL